MALVGKSKIKTSLSRFSRLRAELSKNSSCRDRVKEAVSRKHFYSREIEDMRAYPKSYVAKKFPAKLAQAQKDLSSEVKKRKHGLIGSSRIIAVGPRADYRLVRRKIFRLRKKLFTKNNFCLNGCVFDG